MEKMIYRYYLDMQQKIVVSVIIDLWQSIVVEILLCKIEIHDSDYYCCCCYFLSLLQLLFSCNLHKHLFTQNKCEHFFHQDRRVIIWMNDGVTGTWQPRELNTFDDVIWHVSWSVTGNILAVSGGDNKVRLQSRIQKLLQFRGLECDILMFVKE